MANNVSWDNVPAQLIKLIGQKMIGSCEDYIRFSFVCKSWQSVTSDMRQDGLTFLLSPESPLLLLAEKVPEGSLLGCDIDVEEDGYEEMEVDHEDERWDEEDSVSEDQEEDEEASGDEEMEEVFEGEGDEDDEDYDEEEMDEVFEGEEEEDDEDYDGDQDDNEDKEMEDEDGYEEEREHDEEDEEVSEYEGEDEDEENSGEEEDNGEEIYDDEDHEKSDDEDEESEMYEGFEEDKDKLVTRYDQLITSVGSTRGIYSLSTGKTFTVELPEAAEKLILGINKGLVLTIGKNSEANLLHPLLRQQISLPPVSIARKVAMSVTIKCPKENVLGNDTPDLTIMIIYEECGYLGFSRLGDKVWTKVEIPLTGPFVDITFHKGMFYGLHCSGKIFVCHIDDDYTGGGHATGIEFNICPLIADNFDDMYLVDSEGDLWFLVRIRQIKLFRPPHNMRAKYRTENFLVWKLEQNVSEDGHETFDTWIPKKDLGGKAFFIGRNSSISLSASGYIRPNCIYFTDDSWDLYYPDGGGHDMGVFNVESHTIVPHFQGKSIHPISPPLWYI